MIMMIKFYYNLRVRQGISKQGLPCHLHKRGQLVDDLVEAWMIWHFLSRILNVENIQNSKFAKFAKYENMYICK